MADRFRRIVPLQDEGTARPLFCIHAISGSAFAYAGLADLLGTDQPVYGIEAAGFDDDEPPVRSLPDLGAGYSDMLLEFCPDRDFWLLGWSMGGVVAFDMAWRLCSAGAKVRRVILIDVELPWVAPLPCEKQIEYRFIRDLLSVAGENTADLDPIFEDKPDDITPAAMFAAVERSAILPEELDADLLEERYVVFRAHLEALFGYAVNYIYDGPVVHIRSSSSDPAYMRWDTVASDLTEVVIPGNHHSIWRGAALAELAGNVRRVLSEDHSV